MAWCLDLGPKLYFFLPQSLQFIPFQTFCGDFVCVVLWWREWWF